MTLHNVMVSLYFLGVSRSRSSRTRLVQMPLRQLNCYLVEALIGENSMDTGMWRLYFAGHVLLGIVYEYLSNTQSVVLYTYVALLGEILHRNAACTVDSSR